MADWTHFLVIDGVSKTFDRGAKTGRILVIDNVSLVIEEGEFVVFLGPSGCGKTTLMRIVGGLETASAGRVILEGEEVVIEAEGLQAVCFQHEIDHLDGVLHVDYLSAVKRGVILRRLDKSKRRKKD